MIERGSVSNDSARVAPVRVDSMQRAGTIRAVVRDSSSPVVERGRVGSFGGAMVQARGSGSTLSNGGVGSYRTGWAMSNNGEINQASGLQELSPGQSGIQGVASTSVSSAETYYFPTGELGPRMLRVVVVHLTSGAKWK